MHNNFYFLRQLSAQLNVFLQGYSIVSCFSQNKEELVIELNNSKASFFIKASLPGHFSCLSFPREFSRARKNSIDLFPDVILKKVIHVTQFENERSFALELENNWQLIFKMHGNRANVLLAENNVVKEVFNNQHTTDLSIDISSLHRTIDWSKEAFIQNEKNLGTLYFTFGKEVWRYLRSKKFDLLSTNDKWKLLQETIQLLNEPRYYLIDHEHQVILSLLPDDGAIKTFTDPLAAINDFFYQSISNQSFVSERKKALKQLHDQFTTSQNYISKNRQKLNEIQNDHHYQAWGDLIMANMHLIKQGDDQVIVEDFYNQNRKLAIKLKRDIAPQKNAEVFYRKGKNQQIEIDKLKEVILKKEKEIDRLEKNIASIINAGNLKELRTQTGAAGISPRQEKENIVLLPYHEFEFKGYKIWVGKNAEKNDELTLKYSYKEDLWLHAKDVPGSHVLIKYKSGKNFPKDVIERAAELAAYNSKRKTETLCPVIVTPKKFVRKRKGDPAGAVVVEKEEVILVVPRL